MSLLEMSRVGVELGSDLGLITPMVVGVPDDRRVEFTMSFGDASNQDFLQRLTAFDGPTLAHPLAKPFDRAGVHPLLAKVLPRHVRPQPRPRADPGPVRCQAVPEGIDLWSSPGGYAAA